MKTTSIICKLDKDDDFYIDSSTLEYNINDNDIFSYTFWNDNLKKMPQFFTNEGLDILYISLFIFGADRIISRNDMDDCWKRDLTLYIPVLDLCKWNNNKTLLEQMLNYLSGDKWKLEFRSRELTKEELLFKNNFISETTNKIVCDRVCMFSGGLDSFIGLIDMLEDNNKDILFVSHYGGGKGVREYQDALRNEIIQQYSISSDRFLSFYAVAKNGVEDTTRTRSFMFFSHAIALASCMPNKVDLIVPENGLISLNIPLTNSRLGSSSTRTTHPYYMKMLGDLLIGLGIDIRIINPYQFRTKGEMIKECKNIKVLNLLLDKTMSCSHPDQGRMLGERESCHCGTCLPCVIRRAAIKAAGMNDPSIYRDKNFQSGKTAKTNLNSYLLGLKKYNPKNAFLLIQKSGPITSDIEAYINLYKRGMIELSNLLEEYNE